LILFDDSLRVRAESAERVITIDSLHKIRAEGGLAILLQQQSNTAYDKLNKVTKELFEQREHNAVLKSNLEHLEMQNNELQVMT
jgi:hypothetical protein